MAFEPGVLTSYGQEIYFLEKTKDDLFSSMIYIHGDTVCEPVCEPATLISKIKLHNEICNCRDWFDNDDRDNEIPFAFIKKEAIQFIQK